MTHSHGDVRGTQLGDELLSRCLAELAVASPGVEAFQVYDDASGRWLHVRFRPYCREPFRTRAQVGMDRGVDVGPVAVIADDPDDATLDVIQNAIGAGVPVRQLPRTGPAVAPAAAPVWIEIDGSFSETNLLPAEVRVDGGAPVELECRVHLPHTTWHRHVWIPHVPANVVFDVTDDDEIVVFSNGKRLHTSHGPTHAPEKPEPLTVHVVVDRTLVDAERWCDVAIGQPLGAKAPSLYGATGSASSPNAAFREALVCALAPLLTDCKLQLWWFADDLSHGITRPAHGLVAGPWGYGGEVAEDTLAEMLGSDVVFGWASGLDLFDAVDEALAVIARDVALRPGRHAVLIVGDSPPPPPHEHHPLWTELVAAGGAGWAARQSEDLEPALEALRKANIPVDYLLLKPRPGRANPDAQLARLWNQHSRQLLAVERALTATAGLHVTSVLGREALQRNIAAVVAEADARTSQRHAPVTLTMNESSHHESHPTPTHSSGAAGAAGRALARGTGEPSGAVHRAAGAGHGGSDLCGAAGVGGDQPALRSWHR